MSGRLGMSTPALVANFDCGPVAGVRPVLAELADGTWREDPDEAVTLSFSPCAVHPTKRGSDTLDASQPDSDRELDRIRLYTVAEIRVADRVTFEGREWRVLAVKPYGYQAGVWLAEAAMVGA